MSYQKVLQRLEREKKTREDDFSVSRDAGKFLSILASKKCVLELGTCLGYAAIWMGSGAKVNTVEIDTKRAEEARNNISESGLNINVIEGDANEIAKTFDKEVDFVFLDAVKRDYLPQFKSLFERLPVGAMIVADNIISHADKLKDYKAHIAELENKGKVTSVLVQIGTGMEITLKLA